MLKSINEGNDKFTVWGTGTPIREWGYMPDTARFIKYLIDNEIHDIPNPINVGTGIGYTLNEIGYLIKDALNSNIEIINDTTKLDGDPIKKLNVELFKKTFHNFNFTDLKTGIINTINYYKDRI
jgi:GDP-L-fucose synthase